MSFNDPILTCPYDRTHRIFKSVLPYHLVRCGRNHSQSGKVRCPFDACHVVDETYLEKHLENCASSGNIIYLQYCSEPSHPLGTVPLEATKDLKNVTMSEWKEENVRTYNPWEQTQGRNIIRNIIGATKSQRKKFREMERKRILDIGETNIMHSNLRSNFKRMHISSYTRPNPNISILQLIQNLERLNLSEIDSILGTNINTLVEQSYRKNTMDGTTLTKLIEEVLVKKFRELIVQCLNSAYY